MKKLSFGTVVFAALIAAPAMAADLPVKAPMYKAPPPPPIFSWTGIYIGANGGCGYGTHDPTAATTDFEGDPGIIFNFVSSRSGGCFGGGQIGVNYQFSGNWVVGLEADIQGSSIKGNGTFLEFEDANSVEGVSTYESKLTSFGTVRGRLGYAFMWGTTPLLPYITGGWAWGRNQLQVTNLELVALANAPVFISETQTHNGWTVGAGLEVALGSNWSFKGEYLYMNLGSKTYNVRSFDDAVTNPSTNWVLNSLKVNIVRVGLNYRFGWGPVVASY